jgi:hypothetical protein
MAVLTAARRVLLAGDQGSSRGRCLQIRRLANPGGRARKIAHVQSADGSGSLLPQMSQLRVSRRITRALFPERQNGGYRVPPPDPSATFREARWVPFAPRRPRRHGRLAQHAPTWLASASSCPEGPTAQVRAARRGSRLARAGPRPLL